MGPYMPPPPDFASPPPTFTAASASAQQAHGHRTVGALDDELIAVSAELNQAGERRFRVPSDYLVTLA